LEASTHGAYSPSTLIAVAPGADIQLHDFAWGRRQLAIFYAGIVADKMCGFPSGEANIGRHEACHVTIQFLLAAPIRGASIIPVDGHSAGRASSHLPAPGEKSISDEEHIAAFKLLGGDHFDLAEIERFTTALLFDYMPLVRRLAAALLERKSISARRCRQILFRAMKKDLRRARIVAEKDRRAQAAFAAVLRKELRT
jgi:hypothetical protein